MLIFISSNSGWNIKNFREELILRLIKDGNRVVIVAPYDKYIDYLQDLGCGYIRLELKGRGLNPFSEFFTLLKIFWIVYREKPSVVLSFTIKPNIYFGLISKIFNVPLLATVTGLGRNFIGSKIRAYLFSILYKVSLSDAYCCFFQNLDDLHYFSDNKIFPRDKTIIVSGSGINIQSFQHKKNFNKIEFRKNKTFRFLYTGRVIEDKGLTELIDVANSLKKKYKISVKVVGEFDEGLVSNRFCQIFKRAIIEKSIDYYEFVDDIRPYLKNCDCLVQPSHREGASKSILEAMAMGIPVIASDVPGCNNIVKNNLTGLLCKPLNKIDLYNKMKKIIKFPPEKLKKMGLKGRQSMEKDFDVFNVVETYITVIRKCKLEK